VAIGGGMEVPLQATGSRSHATWATWVLILVASALYGCAVFSYIYLWMVSPHVWPAGADMPPVRSAVLVAALLLASSGAIRWAKRRLEAAKDVRQAIGVAILLLLAAFALDLFTQRAVSPSASSHDALVGLFLGLEGFLAATVVLLALDLVALASAGRLGLDRRALFDSTSLLWHYTVAQSLVGLALLHGFPRWVA
jgi:heme/copper-type cytochrome/quinol oxidase subunit 3